MASLDQVSPTTPRVAPAIVRIAALVAMLVTAILAFIDPDYWLQSILAATNVGLGASLLVVIWRRHGLPATPTLAFLPGFIISWPVTSLYFAFFLPDATFFTTDHEIRYLDNGVMIQTCVLVFFLGYGSGLLSLAPRVPPKAGLSEGSGFNAASLEWGLVLLALVSTTAGWLAPVVHGGSVIMLIGNGLRNYFSAFVVIAGYRWVQWSWTRRSVVAGVLAIAAVMFTLANGRGLALWSPVLLLFGFFISPYSSRRWKVALLTGAAVLLPIYSVVGNQTRESNLGVGFNNMDDRAKVLSNALQTGDLKYESTGFVADFLSRMYSCGGSVLIGASSEDPTLFEFNLEEFVGDAALSLIPGFLGGRTTDAKYASSAMLSHYFVINETTSVEVSLVGSLFTYFGLPSVFLGSAVLGVMQAGVCWLIVKGKRSSAWQLTLIASLVSINIVNFNIDWVGNVRSLVWGIFYALAALAGVQVIELLLRDNRTQVLSKA